VTDPELARWCGSVDAKLEAIGKDAATAAHRTNNHAERIQSLERTRAVVLALIVPFQIVFGALVSYVTKKIGA
jgi:hypothetical protein